MNYRIKKNEMPHAIEIVSRYAEKRCGTCKHFREMTTDRAKAKYPSCIIKPSVGAKIGYKRVRAVDNVCDMWESI